MHGPSSPTNLLPTSFPNWALHSLGLTTQQNMPKSELNQTGRPKWSPNSHKLKQNYQHIEVQFILTKTYN